MTNNFRTGVKYTFNELVEFYKLTDNRYFLLVEYDLPFNIPYLKIFDTCLELINFVIKKFYSHDWYYGIQDINYESYKINNIIYNGSFNSGGLLIYAYVLNENQVDNFLKKIPNVNLSDSNNTGSNENENNKITPTLYLSDSNDSSDDSGSESDYDLNESND